MTAAPHSRTHQKERDQIVTNGLPALLIVLAFISLVAATTATQAEPLPTGAIVSAPEDIKFEECWGAPPGGKCAAMSGDHLKPGLFAHRISLPAGYKMPPHVHPTDEQVVVLSGVYHAGFGETFDKSRTTALSAGSFILIPKGAPHFAWTDGETVVHVYAEGPWGMTPVSQDHLKTEKK